MIGTTRRPISGSRSRLRKQPGERPGRRRGHLVAGAGQQLSVASSPGSVIVVGRTRPLGQMAAERSPALHQVLVFGRVEAGVGVRRQVLGERRVGDRQLEAVAEGPQLGFGHLLDLVGGVAGLEVGPERPALDGLGQDHRRCAAVIACGGVRGVDLGRDRGRRGAAGGDRRRRGGRRAGAGVDPGRRSARGCRRRSRPGTSGTRRRPWRSSCRRARRRRRRRAAGPTRDPRPT